MSDQVRSPPKLKKIKTTLLQSTCIIQYCIIVTAIRPVILSPAWSIGRLYHRSPLSSVSSISSHFFSARLFSLAFFALAYFPLAFGHTARLRYPIEIASRCLINIFPDFLGLHSCPCKASDKFIHLEWVDLVGHFATNLYQNLTVIERIEENTKYQTSSQQTLLFLLLCPQINILWVI